MRDGRGPIGGDFGISNLRTVATLFELVGGKPTPEFIIPDDIAHKVTIGGANIALTHGHHAGSPERFPQWVANQAATPTSPFATANIVVRGHFHSPRIEYSRGRWLLGAPTIDPGSKWLQDKTGEHSNPGMMTFRIHNRHLSDLRVWDP